MRVQRPVGESERLSSAAAEAARAARSERRAFRLDTTPAIDERRPQQRPPSPVEENKSVGGGLNPGARALQQVLEARQEERAHPPPPPGLRMEVRDGVSLSTRFTRFDESARADARRLGRAAERGGNELARELKRVEDDLARRAGPPPDDPAEALRRSMGLNQQLSMRYLALQEELQRGTTSLLSNLLKRRHDAIKYSIQVWPAG